MKNEIRIRPLVLTVLLIVLGSAIAFGFVGSIGSQGTGPPAAPPATDSMGEPDDSWTEPVGSNADGSAVIPTAARADGGSNPGGLPASDRNDTGDGGNLTTLATGSVDDTEFSRVRILSGYDQPIAFTFLPDGRMILLQKDGKLFIANATGSPVAAEPYMTVPNVRTFGEQGLLDITLDPDFANNGRFYVYYTNDTVDKNRISRFEHVENGSGLDSYGRPGSEEIIWQNDDTDVSVCCHFGGGLDVGPEGRLWLTTGDQFNGSAAQDLSVPNGKIIRVNRNGSIPSANPFTDDPDALDAIYAYGLRNPYRAGFDPATDRFFVGEVGGNDDSTAQEDINLAEKGANYGWPDCEGFCDNPNYTDPIYTYPHNGSGASVTVGPVYRGDQFPPRYDGALFYSDYVRGWIKYLSFDGSGDVTNSSTFYETEDAVVQVNQGPDGSLYYTDIIDGDVYRIKYTGNQPPQITETAANRTSGTPPLTVGFAGNATDADGDDLTYTWAFGDGTEATGRTAAHTYTSNGSYDAYLEVSDGTTTVSSDRITVEVGVPPNVTITAPANGTLFRGGETITFEANGTDPDGTLNESRYSWDLLFGHDEHTHPGLDDIEGSAATYGIPTDGHDYSGDTGYTAIVTVTDSDGLSGTDSVSIDPEKVNLTFRTDPDGLEFTLDDRSLAAPNQYDTLVNFTHTIAAPETRCVDGTEYSYANWSDGGDRVHDITVPETDTVYTARYESTGSCEQLVTDGLVLQLESGTGVSTSAGTVTNWIDGSGRGNDLTAEGDPVLRSNATPSGAPAVSFDGDGDALLRNSTLNGFPTANQNRSVFLVADYQSAGSGGFTYGSAACNQAFGTIVDEAGNLAVQGWCGSNDYPTTVSGTDAGWLTQSATLEGTQLTHYRNGSVIDTVTQSYNTNADRLVLGGELTPAPYLDMEVGSVLVYNRSLSDPERQQVQEYLADRYLAASDGPPPAYVNGSLNATLVETDVPNGTTTTLVVEAEFTNGTTRRVTGSVDFTSNDTSVATVGSTGTVTAKSQGIATVNATFGSESDTDMLTVEPATYTEDSLNITLANPTIANGTTTTVAVKADFTNDTTRDITESATVYSNDTDTAIVDDATVTGEGEGTVDITAGYANDTASDELTIDPAEYINDSVTVTLTGATVPNGTTTSVTVTAAFTNDTTQDVTGSASIVSTDTDAATVLSDGTVTADQEGTVTIAADYEGDTASDELTVERAVYLAGSLTVEVANSSIANGTTTAVRVEAGFTNGTTQDVTGSATIFSTDPVIATVSEEAVTAERTGSVDIAAEYNNETASDALTVESAAYVPGSLNVTVAESPVPNGTTTSVTIEAAFTNGTTQPVVGSATIDSNDTDVATVTSDGTVTAEREGSIEITAAYEGDTVSDRLTVNPAGYIPGSINATLAESSIANGTTTEIVVTSRFTNETIRTITGSAVITSNDTTAVAFDDGTGLVTGQKRGATELTASYGGDADTDTLTVTNGAYVAGSINATLLQTSIPNGTTTTLLVEAEYTNGTTQTVTSGSRLNSSETAVAVTSDNGTVRAKTRGIARIGATFQGDTDTETLTVEPAAYVPGSLTIGLADRTIVNGTETSVTVDAGYTDGTTRDITDSVSVSSNDTDTVRIDDGTITGTTPGRVSISADYEGDSDSERLIVEPPPFSGPLTVTTRNSSITPGAVNESATESHDVGAVFENVSRDGNTDTFAITFPDAVAGESLSANSATVRSPADGGEISISSSLSKIDGPDQDGVMDTLTFAVSPDASGTIDVVANVSVDITWPEVDADTTYRIRASAEDSATGNVSLTPVANAAVLNVVISPEPSVTVSPETPEAGTSVTFDGSDATDPDGSIVSYEWDLTGDGTIDRTGETVSHTYASGGEYDVTLAVTDDDGATTTTTSTVTVREPNTGPEASFTITPGSPEIGSTITVDGSASMDPDGAITSYEWDLFDNGSIDATGPTASVAYSEAGEHTVSLIVSDDNGATAETTRVVTVNAPPTAQMSVAPTDPEIDQNVSFMASTSTDPDGSIETYQWDLTGNGTVDATGSEVTRIYRSPGEFQITLTVIDDDGSRTQHRMELTVQPGRTATPGGTETTIPGNTGSNETTGPDTSNETTAPETSADAVRGPDSTETRGPGQPGFGIGATIAGIGGAAYMLRRRLSSE